ncbi:hypothetical protein Vlu01_25630 [Micromonospora lutea]|uniref:Uncharacterized protein n=1 Tax=Micromonospora lutea TaxID=419825 RepID=A0ABQ4IVI4_9ACTN|nr:hypothetical protein Vlu01_25630 [Micromonospora lutea]
MREEAGLADAERLGQMPEGEPVEAAGGGEADGGVQHGAAGALTPGEPAVDVHAARLRYKTDRSYTFIAWG